uniref:ECSIT N-terminal domain-containing protein n=1 Tax=Otus sunia TaxID=257818 RepID=A0A8C8EAF2_9STRI
MPALGVARQREAYHRLLRLLPRGPWVPRGSFQRMLAPFPRQQECGLQILEQMERYGVVPDAETRFLLLGVFGPRSRPVRKCQRLLYWLPRMRHVDPHPLPQLLPPSGLATARLGLHRIANDPDARVTVYQVGHGDRHGDGGHSRGARGQGMWGWGCWGTQGDVGVLGDTGMWGHGDGQTEGGGPVSLSGGMGWGWGGTGTSPHHQLGGTRG